ncbi:MAG: AAA family ATPase [Bacillota bacterium]|nr:AAA family ATPase [Bacillota bacterium]
MKIKPRSELYRGEFTTTVLDQKEKTWVIGMPEVKGKFIPLPVGTVVEVSFLDGNKPSFQSEIVGRSFIGGRNLTITAPLSISRGGRNGKNKSVGRVIAFSSGKGGVGKSTITINVALALQSLGKRCCIIDVDLGTANVDVLLQLKTPYNLYDLISGEKEIEDIIVTGPQGLLLVPGGSGLDELANLKEWQFSRLISAFNKLEEAVDYLLLDTGAGVSRNVTNFLMAADEIVLIAVPEPHAIMDVYSLIKVLTRYEIKSRIKLIVNKVEEEEEAYNVWNTISSVSREFLDLPVEYLGLIPYSDTIALSVKKQEPFLLYNPKHPAAKNFLRITELLTGEESKKEETGFLPFINKLKRIFKTTSL